MGHFATAFKREAESPSAFFTKEAGLWNTFKTKTTPMGPALALGGSVPDLMGSYKSYKDLGKIDEETPEYDDNGDPLDPEERKRRKQKAKREAAGGVGEGIGSALGGLAGFLLPGGPIVAGAGALATSYLGRKAGRAAGESFA
jgi:hypothetical protein